MRCHNFCYHNLREREIFTGKEEYETNEKNMDTVFMLCISRKFVGGVYEQ